MCDSCRAYTVNVSDTHAHSEQFLKLTVDLGFLFLDFLYVFVCSCVVCFSRVGFSLFGSKQRDWPGRMSPK